MDVNAATGPIDPGPTPGSLHALDEFLRARRASDTSRGPTVPKRETAAPLRMTELPLPRVQDLAREMAKNRNVTIEEMPAEGGLKFSLKDADLLTRFSIDKDINRVVITMYQPETGEVVKEFPPRQVLDVMAAIAGRGFTVDVSS